MRPLKYSCSAISLHETLLLITFRYKLALCFDEREVCVHFLMQRGFQLLKQHGIWE